MAEEIGDVEPWGVLGIGDAAWGVVGGGVFAEIVDHLTDFGSLGEKRSYGGGLESTDVCVGAWSRSLVEYGQRTHHLDESVAGVGEREALGVARGEGVGDLVRTFAYDGEGVCLIDIYETSLDRDDVSFAIGCAVGRGDDIDLEGVDADGDGQLPPGALEMGYWRKRR